MQWISFAEAVVRAGSLEALRPHLLAGRIMARYSHLCFWPGGEVDNTLPTTLIDPSWWADDFAHNIKPEAGRAEFTTDLGNELAIGIELERAAVDALWPVNSKQPPSAEPAETLLGMTLPAEKRVAATVKRSKPRNPAWKKIFEHFDPIVATRGKWLNPHIAATEVTNWAADKGLNISFDAIYEGIPNFRPEWID